MGTSALTLAAMPRQRVVVVEASPPSTACDGDEDGRLLRAAVDNRDEVAWQRLVERNFPAVYRQALRACGDPGTAEDVAQEVFLKVVRAAKSFRGDRPFNHWLARITSTTTVDVLRRRRPVASLEEAAAPGVDDPEAAVARADRRRLVREAVLRLPAHLRDVVFLTVFAELSYEDAARALGISVRTALSRALAARARLRRSLAGLEEEA